MTKGIERRVYMNYNMPNMNYYPTPNYNPQMQYPSAMFSYGVKLTLEQEELLADLLATYGNEIISVTNKIFNKIKGGY